MIFWLHAFYITSFYYDVLLITEVFSHRHAIVALFKMALGLTCYNNNKIQTSFAAMLAIQNFGFHSFQNEISLSMKLQQKKWKKCLIAFQWTVVDGFTRNYVWLLFIKLSLIPLQTMFNCFATTFVWLLCNNLLLILMEICLFFFLHCQYLSNFRK